MSPPARARRQRLASLEVLRGLAAVLVVLFHVEGILAERAGVHPLGGWFGAGRTGVDLFFVLSGFIIAYVHGTDVGRPRALATYAYNRFTRIYPSVWVVSAFAAAVYWVGFGGASKTAKLSAAHVVPSVLLIAQREFPLVNVTWTLAYEVLFYVLFGLCLWRKRVGVAALLAWQGTVLALALSGTVPLGGVWTLYLQPFCAEFGFGILCAIAARRLENSRVSDRMLWVTLAVGILAFVGGLVVGARIPQAVTPLRALAMYGVSSAAMVVGASGLELRGRMPRSPSILTALGGASYAVYLVHYSVISLLAVVVIRTGGVPVNAALALGLAVCGVAAGLAFNAWVDQPLHRALQRLWKRRTARAEGARMDRPPVFVQPVRAR